MSATDKSHRWGNADARGARACNNHGCMVRVRDSFREWQRFPGGPWHRQMQMLIPDCAGTGPVITPRSET